MWVNPDYKNASIDKYNLEILRTFMWALNAHVTISLTLVYIEVLSNIQRYIFTRTIPFLQKNKCQGIRPKNMLPYLDIHSIFVSDVYMDDIDEMICKLHHLNLDK